MEYKKLLEETNAELSELKQRSAVSTDRINSLAKELGLQVGDGLVDEITKMQESLLSQKEEYTKKIQLLEKELEDLEKEPDDDIVL